MQGTLVKMKLVPSCMIYFTWSDIPETKAEHGPFLNISNLKDNLV